MPEVGLDVADVEEAVGTALSPWPPLPFWERGNGGEGRVIGIHLDFPVTR
jgi:hypothetical protein